MTKTMIKKSLRAYISGGKFVYETQEALIDFLSHHLAHPQWPPEQVRAHLAQLLPQLDHWRDRGEE